MDLPDDAQALRRDLVKAARQKFHPIEWVDRNGTDRLTTVNHQPA